MSRAQHLGTSGSHKDYRFFFSENYHGISMGNQYFCGFLGFMMGHEKKYELLPNT